MDAIAEVVRGEGVHVEADALARAEGAAKRRYEAQIASGATHEDGWARFMTTLLSEAGLAPDVAARLVAPVRREHDRLNLWRRVTPSTLIAIDRARAIGLRLGVVSNSEGHLDALFAHVGLGDAFEVVVDSAHEGIRKPDPRIFERALERLGVAAPDALYAGDMPEIDVHGAEAAGMRAVLIDPFGFFPEFEEAPRFQSVSHLVDAIETARTDEPSR